MSTRATLLAEVATSFANNTVGAITPTILRTQQNDLINSAWIAATDGTPVLASAPNTFTALQTFNVGSSNNILSTTSTCPASPPSNVFTPNEFLINAALTGANSIWACYGYLIDTGSSSTGEGGGVIGRYGCTTSSTSIGHAIEARNDTSGTAAQYDGLFVFMDAQSNSFTNSQSFNGIYIRPEIYLADNSTPSTTGLNIAINVNACVGGSVKYSLLGHNAIAAASANGTIGYAPGTGAGGAIAQITSRSTGVVLNKPCGIIQLVSAAGSTTPTSVIVTNSTVGAVDTVIVNQLTGADLYQTFVTAVISGAFRITFFTTGGTTTEQPIFGFSVIKSSNN